MKERTDGEIVTINHVPMESSNHKSIVGVEERVWEEAPRLIALEVGRLQLIKSFN